MSGARAAYKTAVARRSTDPMACERHPDREWPHDDCPGPGMPAGASRTALADEVALGALHALSPADHLSEAELRVALARVGVPVDDPFAAAALDAHRASLTRACAELDKVAAAIEALPPRHRRKLMKASAPNYTLDPGLIRNEAERGRDTLGVYQEYEPDEDGS